jgi:hypothetical protein
MDNQNLLKILDHIDPAMLDYQVGMVLKGYTVYLHINKSNGKKYVGITRNHVKRRWDYGRGYIHNDRFFKAIQKYSWDGFYHCIIATNLTIIEAGKMECELISKYNLTDRRYGYNLTSGGEIGKSYSEETKNKISQSQKGKIIPEATRKKMSDSHRGKPHLLSQETRRKIGLSNRSPSEETRKK